MPTSARPNTRYGDVIGKATWLPQHACYVWDERYIGAYRGPWMVRMTGARALVLGYHADDLTVLERSGGR